MSVGRKLKTFRKDKGLTLDELAEMTGVAKATLSRIENGIVGGNYATFKKISGALGITIEELSAPLENGISFDNTRGNQIELAILRPELKEVTQKLVSLCAKIGITLD